MLDVTGPATQPLATKASVLVVDDNPANVELLNEILRHRYRVHFALSGEDAIATARRHLPDLILLDIMMPTQDGYATCTQLKAIPETQDIPIIFVTSMDRIEDEENGLALGAVDYIAKPFSPAIVRLRVANHIELKQQRDLLLSLSQLDGLTGIANRRAFDTALDRLWYMHVRQGQALSLAMIDIDHFKLFNDHYGHSAGDACLKQVAEVIAASLKRGQDMASRFGGEEFAVLMPDTDSAGARSVAQRILDRIHAMQIPHKMAPDNLYVNVSIGVGSCMPNSDGVPLDLLRCADSALYGSKNSGRGTITALEMP